MVWYTFLKASNTDDQISSWPWAGEKSFSVDTETGNFNCDQGHDESLVVGTWGFAELILFLRPKNWIIYANINNTEIVGTKVFLVVSI